MISAYLNQTAEYRPRLGADDRGGDILGEAITIRCRRQRKAQTVYRPDGQTVKTQHVYYLTRPVKEGDSIDGLTIAGVSEWAGLNGGIEGYKAVM